MILIDGGVGKQVSMPAGATETGPVAISFLARRGSDHLLLDTAVLLHTAVQENAKASSRKL